MSCLKNITWEITPIELPKVIRNCPKCGNNSLFINTKKFRVNANKNNLDIWLIYQCEKCKSTWNMSIYERINPKDITLDEYNKFLSNDINLAVEYSFNSSIFKKNKVNLYFDNIKYNIIGEDINIIDNNSKIILNIISKFPLDIRLDKILSSKLNISREKIKKLYNSSIIHCDENKNLLKEKVKEKNVIYFN